MKFALLGYKIAYSLSPLIHELISNRSFDYNIIDIAPDQLNESIPDAFEQLSGFNVTIPHKKTIMDHCKVLDPIAEKIGAVNTVDIRNGIWKGYNTDYLGFVQTVKEYIPDYISYHPVIIGYGGVARAVAFGLKKLGYMSMTVQGGELKAERDEFINSMHKTLKMNVFDLLPEIPRLWINCTPIGGTKIPDIPDDFIDLDHEDYLYDLNYAPYPTHLESKAKKMGIQTMNGLKMLVCQAIEAQKIWFNDEPPVEVDVNSIIHSIAHINTVS
ncbi:MAG: shikimate dehydrogenase [Candidatus Marinimicrobia bacterium]|nr:shikimate dehydrogenase [Candidatus Neomarinimicrobiota bacterium]